MLVPIVDLARQYEQISGEVLEAIDGVLRKGDLFNPSAVAEFEERFSRLCGRRYGVGVASGTDALQVTLMALDIGKGQEVVTTPLSFYATTAAVVRCGAQPIFVDIDRHSFNLDASAVLSALTPNTAAILPVDLYGQMARLDVLERLAAQHKLRLIVDCAQSVGAELQGQLAGSFGIAACFSFHPSKNLGAYGDAGMIVCDDLALAERMRVLRNHGATGKFVHSELGLKSHMDGIQAAVLNIKLQYIKEWNGRRRDLAALYSRLLQDVEEIRLPLEEADCIHTFHKYTILATQRDDLMSYLNTRGILADIYYPVPLHRQPCFAQFRYREGDFPVAEAVCRHALSLPIFPELKQEEVEFICQTIRDFYASAHRAPGLPHILID